MANFPSTNFATAQAQATTSAGIQGGNLQVRSTLAGGKLQVIADTYTIPASAGPASGDSIQFYPTMSPTDVLVFGKVYWDALGAGCTISVGKQDPNNSANTDTVHYLNAVTAAVAGSAEINLNQFEQVGTDPAGDQTTGNTVPLFGNALIIPTVTFGGATPTASAVIKVIFFYVSGT